MNRRLFIKLAVALGLITPITNRASEPEVEKTRSPLCDGCPPEPFRSGCHPCTIFYDDGTEEIVCSVDA